MFATRTVVPAALLVVVTTFQSSGWTQTAWTDSFDTLDTTNRWEIVGGTWSVANGQVSGFWDPSAAQTDHGNLLLRGQDLSLDFDATVKAVIQLGGAQQFILYGSSGNRTVIGLDPTNISVSRRTNGSNYAVVVNGNPGTVSNSVPSAVQVSRRGAIFRVFVNGRYVLEFSDTHNNGQVRIGLGAYTTGVFDSFEYRPVSNAVSDSFDTLDTTNRWEVVGGTWTAANGKVTGFWSQSAAYTDQGNLLLRGQDLNNDYDATVVATLGGGEGGFSLYSSAGNKMNVVVSGSGVYVEKRVNAAVGAPYSALANALYVGGSTAVASAVKLSRRGSSYTIFINGAKVLEFVDSTWAGRLRVGFKTYGTSTYDSFDYVPLGVTTSLLSENYDFASNQIPAAWQVGPASNIGNRDFANGRMNVYPNDAVLHLSRSLTLPAGTTKLEIAYRANMAGSGSGGDNNVLINFTGASPLRFGHGFGVWAPAGQMVAFVQRGSETPFAGERLMARADETLHYIVTIEDGQVSHRGTREVTGAVLFDQTVSFPGLRVADATQIELRLYTATTPALWMDDVKITASASTTTAVAPAIATQPASQAATLGASATFVVTATGTPAPTYQWRKNGAAIAGATAASYSLSGILLSDAGDYDVVVSNPAGSVTSARAALAVGTFADTSYAYTTLAGLAGTTGSSDGIGSAARFNGPSSSTVDGLGNIYVVDAGNEVIRKVTATGVVTTLAGSPGQVGSADGTGSAARFNQPGSLVLDAMGNLFVTDAHNHTIRKISPAGEVSTFIGAAGVAGSTNGLGTAARLDTPVGLAIDRAGNLYVSELYQGRIRKITPAGEVSTFVSAVGLNIPYSLAADSTGNVFVADALNHVVRKITPAGVVSTFAGQVGTAGTADGTGGAARFNVPNSLAVDGAGNLLVTDRDNYTVRKITPAGVVTTIGGMAGTSASVDGNSTTARFVRPIGISVDLIGNVYICDGTSAANTIRKGTPASVASQPPTITTQPIARTVTAGGSASFSVVAAGGPPLAYQWRKNGSAISGATTSTLTIAVVAVGDAGSYDVVVSNSVGTVTSSGAVLTVGAGAIFAESLTFDTSTLPSPWQQHPNNYGNRDFANQRLNAYSTDATHRIFRMLSMPSGATALEITYRGNTDAGSGIGGGNYVMLTKKNGDFYQIQHGYGVVTAGGQMTASVFRIPSAATSSTLLGENAQARTSGSYTYTIRVQDGGIGYKAVSSTGTTVFDYTASDPTLLVSDLNRVDLGLYVTTSMALWADDLTVRVLGEGGVPTITSQPVARTVASGQPATLAVEATGTAPLSYQWRKAGANIAGATGASFSLASAQIADAGSYDVVVSNSVGSATSSAVALTVVPSGIVTAWGLNDQGQTNVPAGLSGVIAVDGGYNHSVALKSDGSVVAWGLNTSGQTTIPAGLGGVVAIAAGAYHTVALKSDGTVIAWGANNYGQRTVPAGLSGIIAIAAGDFSTVALKADGTVVAWGRNDFGQATVPSGLTGVVAIAAGNAHTSALKSDGTVVVWGQNDYNQKNIPANLTGVVAIAGGAYYTVALKGDGTVVGWGHAANGTVPAGLSGVVAIAAGGINAMALKSDGTLVAWGDNASGQTVIPTGLTGVTGLGVAGSHALVITGLTTPVITQQPGNQIASAGGAVSLRVGAVGGGLGYQWRKGGVALTGATTATLTMPSSQFADSGFYDVVVTNSLGTATSNVARVYVGQSSGTYRLAGFAADTADHAALVVAQFGVGATVADWDEIKAAYGGNLAEFYQMVGLGNLMEAMLVKTGQRISSGSRQYYLQRSDAGLPYSGFAAHDQAGTLYLGSWFGFTMPILAKLPTTLGGPLARYDFESNLNDSSGNGRHGMTSSGVTFETGKVGQAARFSGSGSYVDVPDTRLRPATLSAWIKYDANTTFPQYGVVIIDGWTWENFQLRIENMSGGIRAVAAFHDWVGGIDVAPSQVYPEQHLPSTAVLAAATWYHLAMTYDGATLKLYINGQLDASLARSSSTYGVISTTNKPDVRLGKSMRTGGNIFKGLMDDVRLYNRALTPEEIAGLGAGGASATPPTILAQPENRIASVGSSVVLSLNASGSDLAYQWRKNGTALPGATQTSHTIATVQFSDAGDYDAVVTNSAGSITSNAATLAVSAGGVLSLDQWTKRSSPLAGPYRHVLWNGTRYVASNDSAAMVTSLDGITWTASSTGLSVLRHIAWNGSLFVVVSEFGTLTSPDGVSWTTRSSQPGTGLYGITWGGGQFVAVGYPGAIFTSPDGVTWTSRSSGIAALRLSAVAWSGSQYVVTGAGGTVLTSPDGVTWTSRTSGTAQLLQAIVWMGNTFVAVGANGTIVTSSDGVTWTSRSSGTTEELIDVLWNGSQAVAVGSGGKVLSSIDGATWVAYNSGVTSGLEGVAWNGSQFALVGQDGTILTSGALAAVAPVISVQPVSQAVNLGATVTFSVAANGTPAPSYQWMRNGTNLPGANGSSLTITTAQLSDAGNYAVLVANSAGNLVSSAATLTVSALAPSIVTQPQSRNANVGDGVTFTVGVTGTSPFAYQWWKNGASLAGGTASTLTLTSTAMGDAGNYNVVVTNAAGSVNSNAATLTVIAPSEAPIITSQPQAASVNAGLQASFTVTATGTPIPTYQWLKNGVSLAGATLGTLTLANAQPGDAALYSVVVANSGGSAVSNAVALTVNVAPVIAVQPAGQTVNVGTSVTFAVAASGSPAPTYQWRKGGTGIEGATTSSYTIPNVQASDAASYDVVVSNVAGSETSAAATLSLSGGAVAVAPAITTQPVSQTANPGNTVSFAVVATGSPAPTFQWLKNGAPLSGATNAILSLANIQTTDAANYTAIVSNSAGSVISNAAGLIINQTAVAPAITTQPASQTVNAGANVTFVAAASGTPTPSFQWLKNGASIANATAATLALSNVQSVDAANYTVIAANSAGSAISNAATLTVSAGAPTIVTQPQPQTVSVGASVSLSVVAGGGGPFTYQWMRDGALLAGATAASLTVPSAQANDAGNYTVLVSNAGGSTISNPAAVVVNAPVQAPVITTQPAAAAANVGISVTFTVVATGSPTPTYQWLKNGGNLPGATSATLTLPNVQVGDAGNYTVFIYNTAGYALSNAAALTVSTAPAAPTALPAMGITATSFMANWSPVGGAAAYDVQVRDEASFAVSGHAELGHAELAAVTNQKITNLVPQTTYYYRVRARNSSGEFGAYSNVVSVTTADLPPSPVAMTATEVTSTSFKAHWQDVVQAVSFDLEVKDEPTFAPQGYFVQGHAELGKVTSRLVEGLTPGTTYYFRVRARNSVGDSSSASNTISVTTLQSAPTITLQPLPVSVALGGTATFQVAATGSPPLSYQWRKISQPIPGATNATLTLTNVQLADATNYNVLVSNASGAQAKSASALLTIVEGVVAPTISSQPVAQTVAAGSNAAFTVLAEGGAPLAYQWKKNGTDIPGATSATLSLSNVQSADAGGYHVVVSNSAGTVSSASASLAVASSSGVTASLTVNGPAIYTPSGGTLSLTATINYQGITGTSALAWTVMLPAGFSYRGGTNEPGAAKPDPGAVGILEWAYSSIPANSATFTFQVDYAAGLTGNQVLSSSVVYRTPLQTIFVPDVQLTRVAGPTIVTHPGDKTVAVGSGVTLAVTATSTTSMTYQWRKGGQAITGATNATLALSNVQLTDGAVYDVVVTNSAGAVTSNPATLTVLDVRAAQAATGGYIAGGTITVTNTLTYTGTASALAWQTLIPTGWNYQSGSGALGGVVPASGTTELLEWAWTTVPPSPVTFTYTLNVPTGVVGEKQLASLVIFRQDGSLVEFLAKPDPLTVSDSRFHTADTGLPAGTPDGRISLLELTRVIELFNTRNGTTRTGAYKVQDGSEDGFAPEPTRASATVVTLARYHAADTGSPAGSPDGKISLLELTRIIELFNYRSGTSRTGEYHSHPGSEDGFAPGPVSRHPEL